MPGYGMYLPGFLTLVLPVFSPSLELNKCARMGGDKAFSLSFSFPSLTGTPSGRLNLTCIVTCAVLSQVRPGIHFITCYLSAKVCYTIETPRTPANVDH
jgi:hypothetical protein